MSLLILAFGSNLGDRFAHITRAINLLDGRVGRLLQVASPIETEPEGFVSDNTFLNSAATFETELAPEDILEITREVERLEGRTRKTSGGGYTDRPLDIDLIALGDTCLTSDKLTIPHPEAHKRRFVLHPIAEIVPDVLHPVLGVSYAHLLERLKIKNVKIACIADINNETLARMNELLELLSNNAQPLLLDDLRHIITCEGTTLILARDEANSICGMTTVVRCILPTGVKAWVEDVVVHPTRRGLGYGRALLKAAYDVARLFGSSNLNLTSRPTRCEANALYRSLGYELRETNVYRIKLK